MLVVNLLKMCPATFDYQFLHAFAQIDVELHTCLRYRTETEIVSSCRGGENQFDGLACSSIEVNFSLGGRRAMKNELFGGPVFMWSLRWFFRRWEVVQKSVSLTF